MTTHRPRRVRTRSAFEHGPNRADAPLFQINASGKAKGYLVPQELGMVIAKSLEFCRLTGGALDITVKPLLSIYEAASAQKRAPSDSEIKSALQRVGYQKVSVSEDLMTVTIADDRMALDLSATAKGYAADEAARALRESGIQYAFVEAGGDICFIGPRGDGRRFHPDDQQRQLVRALDRPAAAFSDGADARSRKRALPAARHQ